MKSAERRHRRRALGRRRCPSCRADTLRFDDVNRGTISCDGCGWYGTWKLLALRPVDPQEGEQRDPHTSILPPRGYDVDRRRRGRKK